ncbi:MAG: hypothetical protein M3499_02230, partial [Actinomycetota bacterium]|nr:hypothetical protein [Actinomycetota bacterium]
MDEAKEELLTQAAALSHERRTETSVDSELMQHLLEIYYRHVPAEDLLERSPADIYGAAMSQYRLAAHR